MDYSERYNRANAAPFFPLYPTQLTACMRTYRNTYTGARWPCTQPVELEYDPAAHAVQADPPPVEYRFDYLII